jgi:hypothetical protein
MQVQEFSSMEEAAATFPRLMAKVTVPTPYETEIMLYRGQRKLRSGYHVRPGKIQERWKFSG